EIKKLIENSNPADPQNSTRTQLQIWIIVTGGNLNYTSGEASALTQKLGVNSTDINNQITEARANLVQVLNITEGEIKNLSPNSSTGIDVVSWINEFINWFKNSFNIS
ncbi:MAG TPA: hypothetical protein VMC48_00895, partial [Methanobacterium sp.]|nr:hypothetical protein [Methanobacterium sp.]